MDIYLINLLKSKKTAPNEAFMEGVIGDGS